jgi:hypothetical protein
MKCFPAGVADVAVVGMKFFNSRANVVNLAGNVQIFPHTPKQPIPMASRNKEEPLSGTLVIPWTPPPEAILMFPSADYFSYDHARGYRN